MKRMIRFSLVLVAAAGVLGSECTPKEEAFFRSIFGGGDAVDDTAPVITNPQPSMNVILNDDDLGFTATDPPLQGGQAGSGVNVDGITATSSSGMSLPLSHAPTPDTHIVDISSLPDGLQTVEVGVPDKQGNVGMATFRFTKDTQAPMVNVTDAPPATGSTDQPTAQFGIAGTASDANLRDGMLFVRMGQAGQACSESDPPFPQGTGPGQVDQNTVTLGPTFDVTVTTTGAPDDQRPRTTLYCFQTTFSDRGVDKTGAANPNVATQFFGTEFTWERTSTVPTGTEIQGSYRLDGRVVTNTCSTDPPPGTLVNNPGPIAVTSEQVGGQTFVTIQSNAAVRGMLNTQTGEWTGTGTVALSGPFILQEMISGGRWQLRQTIEYNTAATVGSVIIDTRGTSDTGDDVIVCEQTTGEVTYTRLEG